jgi:adenylate kinase family enzyme
LTAACIITFFYAIASYSKREICIQDLYQDITRLKRILVIGNPGAGKSILARSLGEILELPVTHLDRHFWNPGWVVTPTEDFRKQVAEMVVRDEWIIDGTFMSSLELRLPRAEGVIFLDFPTPICMRRIFQRVFEHRKSSRPDMAEGCSERVDLVFFKYTLTFRRKIRPSLIEKINRYYRGSCMIKLKNPAAVAEFVDRLKSGY